MVSLDLTTPYPLTADQIESFRTNGFIKLKNVLDAETLAYYGAEITRLVLALNTQTQPMHTRSTYAKAFLQIANLWLHSDIAKVFVLSQRLGRLAAELMQVSGVRLYHDQALYKEAGGGITPWHADQYYWPLASDKTVIAWIPFQTTPKEMGPLEFCVGSQKYDLGRNLPITDESEKLIKERIKISDFPVLDESFDLGEISFHQGWTFHRAGVNSTDRPRAVMTVIYMDENMRLMQPRNDNQLSDWRSWCPGAEVGEIINTPKNPLIYSTSH